MIPLKQFLEQTSEQVEQLFKKTGRLLPMYHVVEQNGRHVIMPPPPDATKDEAIALIKALFLLIRPQRYIFCDEAWTIDAHGEEAIARAIDFVRSHGSAKDHPDCKEVVIFQAEDRQAGQLTGRRLIIRRAGRKPRLGPLQIDDTISSEGRMVGLLPRDGSVH
jgi:hypothetical protein